MGSAVNYPLVFTFSEVIVGRGFAALVDLRGRAVLSAEEDGDIWLYGVQPGAVAGGGRDFGRACRAFKENYLSVLFDIAEESVSFEEFQRRVQRYFEAANEPTSHDWQEALRAVRAGSTTLEGLSQVAAEEHVPSLKVRRLEQQTMQPALNKFDEVLEAA